MEILYCFVTGVGEDICFIESKNNMNEEKAWQEALDKGDYNEAKENWENDKWGKIELSGCSIWIKKKSSYDIEDKVEDNHGSKITEDLKSNISSSDQIDTVVIFVHAVNGVSEQVKNINKLNINSTNISVKWLYYTTAGGGAGAIDVVKFVIQRIYENNISDICKKLSENVGIVEKKSKEEKRKKHLRLLTHSIAHLFLPLDIDLMGILDVLRKGDESKAEEYYKEAFDSRSPCSIFKDLHKKAEDEINKIPDDMKRKICSYLNNFKDEDIPNSFDDLMNWAKEDKNPFHDWFCALMNELEKLKNSIGAGL